MKSVKDDWKLILISILLIAIYFLFNKTESLEKKIQDASLKAKEHETKARLYEKTYDKLIQKGIRNSDEFDRSPTKVT